MVKKIRRLDVENLSKTLFDSYNSFDFTFDSLINWKLNGYTNKYIKHFLARITGFIEEKSDKTNKYIKYVDRYLKDPYEIEHITPDHFKWYEGEYESRETFDAYRNSIGDLLLLPKSVNASLNDSTYDYKVKKYCSNEGNILSAALGEITYKNNTRFINFMKDYNLPFKAYNKYGKREIEERFDLIKRLTDLIWDENNLKY